MGCRVGTVVGGRPASARTAGRSRSETGEPGGDARPHSEANTRQVTAGALERAERGGTAGEAPGRVRRDQDHQAGARAHGRLGGRGGERNRVDRAVGLGDEGDPHGAAGGRGPGRGRGSGVSSAGNGGCGRGGGRGRRRSDRRCGARGRGALGRRARDGRSGGGASSGGAHGGGAGNAGAGNRGGDSGGAPAGRASGPRVGRAPGVRAGRADQRQAPAQTRLPCVVVPATNVGPGCPAPSVGPFRACRGSAGGGGAAGRGGGATGGGGAAGRGGGATGGGGAAGRGGGATGGGG